MMMRRDDEKMNKINQYIFKILKLNRKALDENDDFNDMMTDEMTPAIYDILDILIDVYHSKLHEK